MMNNKEFFAEIRKARKNALKVVDFSDPKRFEKVTSLDDELPFKPNQVLYNINYEFSGMRNKDWNPPFIDFEHYEYSVAYGHSTKDRAELRHQFDKDDCKVKYSYERINFNLGKLMAEEYKWCLMFESEEMAKEYCRIKNEAQKYFKARSLSDAEEPGGMYDKRRKRIGENRKRYENEITSSFLIGQKFYYCVGNQIKEVIPKTGLEVEKLYADKEGKLFDDKMLLTHDILNFGWQDLMFQYLPKEKVKEIIENNEEDTYVHEQRKKERKAHEEAEKSRPIGISYFRFFYGIEEEKQSFHFNTNELQSIQKECPVKLFIQNCGNPNTYGYPKDLEGFPAIFVGVPCEKDENSGNNGKDYILQYTKIIPGLNKEYTFIEYQYFDITDFYDFLKAELKECCNNKNISNKRVTDLKRMIHVITKNTIETEEQFLTLMKPCHIHEGFEGITEKETEILLNNPQSKKLLADREHIREMLGIPDFD